KTSEHLIASFSPISDKFSVLMVVASSKTAPGSKIEFDIQPSIRESAELAVSPEDPNYLVIQKRKEDQYTLLFRYNPQQIPQYVSDLAEFSDAMIMTNEIRFVL